MTSVNDSITVIPDGMDPKYDDEGLPDPDDWNKTLFDMIGDEMGGIGVHRYNRGIREEDPRSIEEWKDANDAGALDYNEVLSMFPTQFGDFVAETAETASTAYGLEDLEFFIGEWGLYPTVAEGDPWPGVPTMAGASYVAGMFNAFIRESDYIRRASHTHLPVCLFPPEHVEYPANPNPLLPVGYTLGLYATVFDGEQTWGSSSRLSTARRATFPKLVPEFGRWRTCVHRRHVDCDARRRRTVHFLTHRNLRNAVAVTLEIPEMLGDADASVTIQQLTGDPHDLQERLGAFPDSWFDWTSLESYDDRRV